jgi:NAD-dependent SIR2 family protein deacetylase
METLMDIFCTNCGELWDVEHVLHEADPGDFERKGALITRCPCCEANLRTPLAESVRRELAAIAGVAVHFGDDLDAFAAFLEDMELLNPR